MVSASSSPCARKRLGVSQRSQFMIAASSYRQAFRTWSVAIHALLAANVCTSATRRGKVSEVATPKAVAEYAARNPTVADAPVTPPMPRTAKTRIERILCGPTAQQSPVADEHQEGQEQQHLI